MTEMCEFNLWEQTSSYRKLPIYGKNGINYIKAPNKMSFVTLIRERENTEQWREREQQNMARRHGEQEQEQAHDEERARSPTELDQ